MTTEEARARGATTAQEDFAARDGAPFEEADVKQLAQQWALGELLRDEQTPLARAKEWEAAFYSEYVSTYQLLMIDVLFRTHYIDHHRLRFEVGVPVPSAGDRYHTRRELSGRPVQVTVVKVHRTWKHDDGATLMDADVSLLDL